MWPERLGSDVPRPAGHERAGRQQLAELRHVDLDHLDRGVRHSGAPEVVDQPVHGDDASGVEEQASEQRLLLVRAEPEGRVAVPGLQVAEDPEFHGWANATPGDNRTQ